MQIFDLTQNVTCRMYQAVCSCCYKENEFSSQKLKSYTAQNSIMLILKCFQVSYRLHKVKQTELRMMFSEFFVHGNLCKQISFLPFFVNLLIIMGLPSTTID